MNILDRVVEFIGEVVGDELDLNEPITMETFFSRDLELESIEFVAVAELVQAEYGRKLDFTGWLSSKDLDELIGLTVGDLVEFIAQCQL